MRRIIIWFCTRKEIIMRTFLIIIGLCSCFASTHEGICFSSTEKNNPGSSFLTENEFYNSFYKGLVSVGSTKQNENMIKYFSNLYDYSPLNSIASCGYVSFAQYLSYYDTFYNDSIIPEKYERNQGSVSSLEIARTISPGVERTSYPAKSGNELYTYIQNNKGSDYQAYLMSIVNDSYERDSTTYRCSTHMRDYHYIVDSISALSEAAYTYKKPSDFVSGAKYSDDKVVSGFDAYVKGILDKNEPVMLHVATGEGTYEHYHSVVAYYYDEKGIHANFGWGKTSTDFIIDGSGYYITEAGKIDFSKVEETHSNNYLVNGEHYCGCGKSTNHIYEYTLYTERKHKAACRCGYYKYESHTVTSGSSSKLFAICTKCYAKVNLSSTEVELASITDEQA